jgi:hypothetical protein
MSFYHFSALVFADLIHGVYRWLAEVFFDGYSLTLYRSDGSIVGTWPAISGKKGNQRPSDQDLPFRGPITEGGYSFSTADIQPMTTLDGMLGVVS